MTRKKTGFKQKKLKITPSKILVLLPRLTTIMMVSAANNIPNITSTSTAAIYRQKNAESGKHHPKHVVMDAMLI